MADLPAPKDPGHVTIPEAEFRALEEKARVGERMAARARALEEEVRLLGGADGSTGLARILRDVLLHLDDFERAIGSARREEDYAALLEGLEAIRSGILETLARQDVRRFSALGDPFRPGLHEAIEGAPAPEGARVVEEMRPGYTWRGRVFRKAWVRVEPGPSPPAAGPPPSPDPPSS